MPIQVDHDRCIGAGSCVIAAPNVFDQNEDDGRVVLLTDQPDPSERDSVREGIAACPVAALAFSED